MRARNIKPGFFRNEQLMQVAPLGRLLFAGLWCLADREGRLLDRPNQIKWDVLPADDCDIGALLDDLAQRGFIRRYEADGKQCILVTGFQRNQNPHHKEKASILPPPPDTAPAQKVPSTLLIPDSLIPDILIPIPSQPKRSKHDLPLLTDDWRPPTTEDEAVSRITEHWQRITGEMPSLSDRQHLRRALRRGHSEQALIDLLTSPATTAQAKPLRLSSILAAELAKARSSRTISAETKAPSPDKTVPPAEMHPLTKKAASSDAVRTLPERTASSDAVRTLTERAASSDAVHTLTERGTSSDAVHTLPERATSDEVRTAQDTTPPAARKTADFFTGKDGNTGEVKSYKPSKQYIDWQEGFFRR